MFTPEHMVIKIVIGAGVYFLTWAVTFTACVVFFEHLSQVAYAAAVIW